MFLVYPQQFLSVTNLNSRNRMPVKWAKNTFEPLIVKDFPPNPPREVQGTSLEKKHERDPLVVGVDFDILGFIGSDTIVWTLFRKKNKLITCLSIYLVIH